MIEHPLTPVLADLRDTLADIRAAEYETPTTPDERRAINWALCMVTDDAEIAEAFDRERFTGDAA